MLFRFLSFAKTMGKNLNGKYSPAMLTIPQKLVDYAKQSATDAFKADSNRAIQKIIQKQLHMSRTKKYLKKDIYLQKKEKKVIDHLRLK